jgi:replicative DNA helicase
MGGVTGITTGFTDLDAVLGGLHKSDLIILAARPSMGKTSMALNIIENCGVPAMFFSLEMARNQLVDRMLSGKSGINLTKLVTGKLNGADWIEINNAAEAVSSLPILIDDSPSLHFSEIRRRARIAFKQIGIKLIVVDYLQLMRGNESKNGNRETEVSNISRALKAIAKELNIPVIALAQLNRDLEKRSNKRPELSDLRESGSIEQDADIVMFIYREEVYTKANTPEELKNKAEIIVAKHRNGPTGFAMLSFDKSTTTFRNLYRR